MEEGLSGLSSLVQSWLKTSQRSLPCPVVVSPRPDRLGLGASDPSKLTATISENSLHDVRFQGQVAQPPVHNVSIRDHRKSAKSLSAGEESLDESQLKRKNKQKKKPKCHVNRDCSHSHPPVKTQESCCDSDGGTKLFCSHSEKMCAQGCGQLLRGGSNGALKHPLRSPTVSVTHHSRRLARLWRRRHHRTLGAYHRIQLIDKVYQTRLRRYFWC